MPKQAEGHLAERERVASALDGAGAFERKLIQEGMIEMMSSAICWKTGSHAAGVVW